MYVDFFKEMKACNKVHKVLFKFEQDKGVRGEQVRFTHLATTVEPTWKQH